MRSTHLQNSKIHTPRYSDNILCSKQTRPICDPRKGNTIIAPRSMRLAITKSPLTVKTLFREGILRNPFVWVTIAFYCYLFFWADVQLSPYSLNILAPCLTSFYLSVSSWNSRVQCLDTGAMMNKFIPQCIDFVLFKFWGMLWETFLGLCFIIWMLAETFYFCILGNSSRKVIEIEAAPMEKVPEQQAQAPVRGTSQKITPNKAVQLMNETRSSGPEIMGRRYAQDGDKSSTTLPKGKSRSTQARTPAITKTPAQDSDYTDEIRAALFPPPSAPFVDRLAAIVVLGELKRARAAAARARTPAFSARVEAAIEASAQRDQRDRALVAAGSVAPVAPVVVSDYAPIIAIDLNITPATARADVDTTPVIAPSSEVTTPATVPSSEVTIPVTAPSSEVAILATAPTDVDTTSPVTAPSFEVTTPAAASSSGITNLVAALSSEVAVAPASEPSTTALTTEPVVALAAKSTTAPPKTTSSLLAAFALAAASSSALAPIPVAASNPAAAPAHVSISVSAPAFAFVPASAPQANSAPQESGGTMAMGMISSAVDNDIEMVDAFPVSPTVSSANIFTFPNGVAPFTTAVYQPQIQCDQMNGSQIAQSTYFGDDDILMMDTIVDVNVFVVSQDAGNLPDAPFLGIQTATDSAATLPQMSTDLPDQDMGDADENRREDTQIVKMVDKDAAVANFWKDLDTTFKDREVKKFGQKQSTAATPATTFTTFTTTTPIFTHPANTINTKSTTVRRNSPKKAPSTNFKPAPNTKPTPSTKPTKPPCPKEAEKNDDSEEVAQFEENAWERAERALALAARDMELARQQVKVSLDEDAAFEAAQALVKVSGTGVPTSKAAPKAPESKNMAMGFFI